MMLRLPSLPLFHQPAPAGAGEKVGVGAPEKVRAEEAPGVDEGRGRGLHRQLSNDDVSVELRPTHRGAALRYYRKPLAIACTMGLVLVGIGLYELKFLPESQRRSEERRQATSCEAVATSVMTTEGTAHQAARLFLQGWVGAYRRDDAAWRDFVFPRNASQMRRTVERDAAMAPGVSVFQDLDSAGVADALRDIQLHLSLAPIIHDDETRSWERIWNISTWRFDGSPFKDVVYASYDHPYPPDSPDTLFPARAPIAHSWWYNGATREPMPEGAAWVYGVDVAAYLGSRRYALETLMRRDFYVEKHGSIYWSFFLVIEENGAWRLSDIPTRPGEALPPMSGPGELLEKSIAIGVLMHYGPDSLLQSLTSKHQRITFDNRGITTVVDRRRTGSGRRLAKTVVDRGHPFERGDRSQAGGGGGPYRVTCEEYQHGGKKRSAFVALLVSAGTICTLTLLALALVWKTNSDERQWARLLGDHDAIVNQIADGVIVVTRDASSGETRVQVCNNAVGSIIPGGEAAALLGETPLDGDGRAGGTALEAILGCKVKVVTFAVEMAGRTIELKATKRRLPSRRRTTEWVVCVRDVTERFALQRELARCVSLERMALFVVGVRPDLSIALWSDGAREVTGLAERPEHLRDVPFKHDGDLHRARSEVERIKKGGMPRPFALSLRASNRGFVALVMQNVRGVSGDHAATFIGTPIDGNLLSLAAPTSQCQLQRCCGEATTPSAPASAVLEDVAEEPPEVAAPEAPAGGVSPTPPARALCVPVATPVPSARSEDASSDATAAARAAAVDDRVARSRPSPPSRRGPRAARGGRGDARGEAATARRLLAAVPPPRDPGRLRGVVLGPGEGTVLLVCELVGPGPGPPRHALHGYPLIPAASFERRFEVGDSAWELARADASFELPPGTYAFAHAPGESAIRVGVGERFERLGALGGEETREHAAWYALVGLGGADLLARYDHDFVALHDDLRCVAGGTLEVGEGGSLERWVVANTYVDEPCECLALASRVPLPLDKLWIAYYSNVGDFGALLARDGALRESATPSHGRPRGAARPRRTGETSFLVKASTVEVRPYGQRVALARQCAVARTRVHAAASRFSADRKRRRALHECLASGNRGREIEPDCDATLLNTLLQAQASFLALRAKLRLEGGVALLRRERGERAALRKLGLLDERERRFRARRRLLWIGSSDKGSRLSRLPPSLVDAIVSCIEPALAPATHAPAAAAPAPTRL
ncbi:hypothetical protein SO694_00146051 [Aureococcus anophagefferens]|uniref:Uncharacterized protein n=1 Tax=Aureococcus anophagefferens TaxID=44056 RepID=A0ABR1FND2_AURAN